MALPNPWGRGISEEAKSPRDLRGHGSRRPHDREYLSTSAEARRWATSTRRIASSHSSCAASSEYPQPAPLSAIAFLTSARLFRARASLRSASPTTLDISNLTASGLVCSLPGFALFLVGLGSWRPIFTTGSIVATMWKRSLRRFRSHTRSGARLVHLPPRWSWQLSLPQGANEKGAELKCSNEQKRSRN